MGHHQDNPNIVESNVTKVKKMVSEVFSIDTTEKILHNFKKLKTCMEFFKKETAHQ